MGFCPRMPESLHEYTGGVAALLRRKMEAEVKRGMKPGKNAIRCFLSMIFVQLPVSLLPFSA
jgi:hypothetical protein